MKTNVKISKVYCCGLSFILLLGAAADAVAADPKISACEVVQDALKAALNLKVGMSRVDVDQQFEPDGGLSVRTKGTYVYRKCRFIKIDVEFEIQQSSDDPATHFSPRDRIAKVSQPYLAYPISD